jgi:hypothetical protein
MKLLISLVDLKFVLTLESHISLDWNFQSLPTYTLRFAHATLQFLGYGGNINLEWRILFILVIISTIPVLMTSVQASSALVMAIKDNYNMDETSLLNVPYQTRHSAR